MNQRTLSGQIADFVTGTPTNAIPREVIEHIKLCLLDTIGCGLFGSTLAPSWIVRDMLRAEGSRGVAAAWGSGVGLTPTDAALVNGTSVHAFELDDLHPRSIVHPGSVVVSAALAAAALRPDTTGRDLLAAIVMGYEVAARVGMSMGASHLLAGWHPTGTHGTLGAAAAAGRILGLDAGGLVNALGTAGSLSGGLMAAQYESMVKRLHAGRAAQGGLSAALLAERGYVGIRDLFGADYGGYLTTFSPRSDPSVIVSDLGRRWESLAVGFKPYSTNGSCHPSIDCLREMYATGVRLPDVASVEIRVSTATEKHVGWPYVPDTVTTAQMNLPYIAAVVLSDGEAFIDQFTDERIRDPELVAFTPKVHVVADAGIDAMGDRARHRTVIRVSLADGTVLADERDHAHGSAHDPMTEDEVRGKYARLAGRVLDDGDVLAVERTIGALESASDLSGLDILATPAADDADRSAAGVATGRHAEVFG